jgi:hypothetical protein
MHRHHAQRAARFADQPIGTQPAKLFDLQNGTWINRPQPPLAGPEGENAAAQIESLKQQAAEMAPPRADYVLSPEAQERFEKWKADHSKQQSLYSTFCGKLLR